MVIIPLGAFYPLTVTVAMSGGYTVMRLVFSGQQDES
jgi:hypothetical protein